MREFESGATRDGDNGKCDFEGFLSPLALLAFSDYMHRHRVQADGELRASDNWQRGIPLDEYMKSGWRHFFDWWLEHRGYTSREGLGDALCGLVFNAMGYLHEITKAQLDERVSYLPVEQVPDDHADEDKHPEDSERSSDWLIGDQWKSGDAEIAVVEQDVQGSDW